VTAESRLRTVPAKTELEVSLFGPGVGECVVVHLGCNDWMVIDSCLDPRSGNPAALDYLNLLEVEVREHVKAVVVTHWHRDHFKGVSALLRAASSAQFSCSNALQSKEFLQFVFRSEENRSRFGTEIEEFAEVFRILRDRSPALHPSTVGPEWAIADRPVFTRAQTADCPSVQVDALSPSSATVSAAITNLRAFITDDAPNRRPLATKPNRLAVALWVQLGGAGALLGADLEDSGQPNMGWNAIVSSNSGRYTGGELFKVAHHGSPTSHNPNVWQAMLKSNPYCILSPNLASLLPADPDVRRLKEQTSNLFATMAARGNRPRRRDSTVERILAGYNLRSAAGTGQVRIRLGASGSSSPQIELFNGALRL